MPKEAKETKSAKRSTTTKTRGSKASAGKPKKARRPLSAYMFFSQDWRERIKTENPDAGFGEIGKLLGAKWKEMDDEEKKPYQDQAAADKVRIEKEKEVVSDEKEKEKSKAASPTEDDDDE